MLQEQLPYQCSYNSFLYWGGLGELSWYMMNFSFSYTSRGTGTLAKLGFGLHHSCSQRISQLWIRVACSHLTFLLALSDHYLFLQCFVRAASTSCAACLGEDSGREGHSGLLKNHQTFKAFPLTPRATADPLDNSTNSTSTHRLQNRLVLVPAFRGKVTAEVPSEAGGCRRGRGLSEGPGCRSSRGHLSPAPISGEDGTCPGASLQPRVESSFPTLFHGEGPRDRLLSAREKCRCIFLRYS